MSRPRLLYVPIVAAREAEPVAAQVEAWMQDGIPTQDARFLETVREALAGG
jgi:hypothetical protein